MSGEKILAVHVHALAREGDPAVVERMCRDAGQLGYRMVILEVDHGVRYERRPEVGAPWAIDKDRLRSLIRVARDAGLEPIPQLQCLGHQDAFLARSHPELMENPRVPKVWCCRNPEVFRIVFDCMEELLELFDGPRWFHVGHDETFDKHRGYPMFGECDRCKGASQAELLAEEIGRLHEFLTAKGARTMLWGDMLLDLYDFPAPHGRAYNGGSPYNTAGAVEHLPSDVIICDWQYGCARNFYPDCPRLHKDYPSVEFFISKGFDVLPSGNGLASPDGQPNLIAHAARVGSEKVLGYMATTWGPRVHEGGALRVTIHTNDRTYVQPSADSGLSVRDCLRQAAEAMRKSFGGG